MSIASLSGSTSAALAQQPPQQAQADTASQGGAQQAGKVHQRHQQAATAQTPVAAAPQAGVSSGRPAYLLDVMA